jgi:signal transduction histidine kinase
MEIIRKHERAEHFETLRSDQHEENFYQTAKKILDRDEIWMGVIFNKGKDGTNFEEGSPSRRRMAQALSVCCRARDLIKQILAFRRQSDQQRKPIEMGPIVEDVFKVLRSALPATIDMRLSLKAAQSIFLGDPTQIHQVIVNLCTNAAHAMRDLGGILEIDLDNVEIDAIEAAEHSITIYETSETNAASWLFRCRQSDAVKTALMMGVNNL